MISKQELIETLIRVDGITPDLNQCDLVICMSEILKEACETVGVKPEKLVTLGNRVSTRRFYPLPQVNYDPQCIRVLFVGRLTEQKNIHGIAQALMRLKQRGWRVMLEVCGGLQVNKYLLEATSCLLPSEWRYHGSVPNRNLPALYNATDMYVGPSLFEGFQIPLIEALACGKPCVASNQPPANEIITPEVGALVDPLNPDSIADGILSVKNRLNDPDQALLLRAACRAMAEQRWAYPVISQREASLYLKVLSDFRKQV